MTIDEAILHAEEVAEGYEEDISKWEYTLSEYRKRECVEQTTIPRCEKALNKCKQCASEHRQLAEWLKDYKRLLEQEPCEDAISRQAVNILVDELARAISDERCYMSRGRGTATIMQDILDLPSVKPQEPKWIPVSERLPKKGGDYLVTTLFDIGGKEPVKEVRKDFFCTSSKKWLYENDTIIAWMPLPKSYKGEKT